RDYFVAAVPAGHPLAERGTITLRELLAYPLVTTSRSTNARRVLERAFNQVHQTLRPQFELVHHFSVGQMVQAGLGVTVLPRSADPGEPGNRHGGVEIAAHLPRSWRHHAARIPVLAGGKRIRQRSEVVLCDAGGA